MLTKSDLYNIFALMLLISFVYIKHFCGSQILISALGFTWAQHCFHSDAKTWLCLQSL